jgi:hypothetical protein
MILGFALFEALSDQARIYEVFPSASYTLLGSAARLNITVRLSDFTRGQKDVLDAYVAAATVREFVLGRGVAVGGGDGLGEIVLPRALPKPIEGVLHWPGVVAQVGQEAVAASGSSTDDRWR